MQIDFHHATTYVVARFSGFEHTHAATIAHAAQYVDDSTQTGFVHFDNGMRFYRQATAHPVYDPSSLNDDVDAESWLPFHFLPGNAGLPAGSVPPGPYLQQLVCRPNSKVAREMIRYAMADRDTLWALHRLGIVAHVFADTWAHQGFVGLNDDINTVGAIHDSAGEALHALPVPPVGHGQAGTFPDQPYLKWSYTGWDKVVVHRDNAEDFLAAAEELSQLFQEWRGVPVQGLNPPQRALISGCFAEFNKEDGDERHGMWLDAIADNRFGFGPQRLDYDHSQWKHQALGDDGFLEVLANGGDFAWNPAFLASDWKLFHDAARRQRHDVFVHVLPQFGILEN